MNETLLDELPILRELGADLRAALRSADADRIPQRPSLWTRWRWSLAAPSAALAAVAVALVIALQSGGITLALASAVLHRAADVAERQPGSFPRDNQFFYLRNITSYWRPVSAQWTATRNPVAPQVRLRVEQQLWFSAGRTGLTRYRVVSMHFASSAARRAWARAGRPSFATKPQRIGTLGANRYLFGNLALTRQQVLTFTTNPHQLYRTLYKAGGSAYEVFVQIGDQLRNRPTPAPQRAALYRALAIVPGIQLVGPVTDSLGRYGEAVAYTSHGIKDELIFDPKTAAMLEERTIATPRNPQGLAAGTITSSTTYIQRAITNRIAAP